MPKNDNIDNGKAYDWGRTSSDYGRYRDIYPEEFYKRIVNLGFCTKGQRVLDLGTGTGVLPRNMYKYGAEFTGLDISENQIETARKMSDGMNIRYVTASAESVGFEDNYFDVVTACQCFMYFDREKVLSDVHRILKENGHFLILYMAYLPYESDIAGMSEKLILKYNPYWTGGHYKKPENTNKNPPEWLGNMFALEDRSEYGINIEFTRESWNGRMKACRGIGASSLPEDKIAEWEDEHIKYLNTQAEKFCIPHWVTMWILRRL